jgi:predicted GIY-YIG superfamily endonuclease
MKERVLKYLMESGKGVPATQILKDVLNIHAVNGSAADGVLAGFLGQDSRFVFGEGLWNVRSLAGAPNKADFDQAVVLHLQSADRPATLQGLRGAIRLMDGSLRDFSASIPTNTIAGNHDPFENHLLVVWSSLELRLWNGWLRSKGHSSWQGNAIYLRNLAARVLNKRPSKLEPEGLASELGISPADWERPGEVAHYLYKCWESLLDRIPDEIGRSVDSLREWIDAQDTGVDFGSFAFGADFVRELPSASGVYLMRNRAGAVIYVGKSRNLKRRVSSYFAPNARGAAKTADIHKHLYSIEIRRTDNEIEALLLEMRLINEFSPVINLQTQIHETPTGRRENRNLLLFIVDAEHGRVKIYCFQEGVFSSRQSASLGHAAPKRVKERIRSLYFARSRKIKRKGKRWEKEIVSRWLRANEKRMNYLDVDDAGDYASVIRRLERYLNDPDRLRSKVYYRG